MNKAKVTSVIVTYQSEATLPGAIEAARRCHEAGVMDAVFVDNASTDGTRALLEETTGWAKVVFCTANVGFGRGCNRGLAEVRTPFAMFLNPDATLSPDVAGKLVQFMEETPQAGICGPAIMEDGGADLQHTGDCPTPMAIIARLWRSYRRLKFIPIRPGSKPFRCEWICGAALMIRTELARKIGGFDPRFFLYFEETDLCKRVMDAGWEIWAVGDAVADHVGGASSSVDDATHVGGCIAKYYYESRFYYFRKHYGLLAAIAADLADAALLLFRATRDTLAGRGWQVILPRLQTLPFRSPPKVQE